MTIIGTNSRKDVLGIDFGGVIAEPLGYDAKPTKPMPGAFFGLKQMSINKFGGEIFIISRCSEKEEQKILGWFEKENFAWYTGIPSGHIIFCRQDHEKARIARDFGVTHFIDDRFDVLIYMIKWVKNLYLLLPVDRMEELRGFPLFDGFIKLAVSFPEIVQDVLSLPRPNRDYSIGGR